MNNVAITVTSLIRIQGVDAICHEIIIFPLILRDNVQPQTKG